MKEINNLNNNRGFTLLEVMISVSIIAFIFISVFRMQSGTIELATAIKFNNIAPMLAQKLLNDIGSDPADWPEVEGDFGQDFPGFQWRMEISESLFETRFKKIQIKIIKFAGFPGFSESIGTSGSKSYKITTWRIADE